MHRILFSLKPYSISHKYLPNGHLLPCRLLPLSPFNAEKNPPFHAENNKFCSLVDIAKGESVKRRQGVPRLLAEALTQP